MSVGDVSIEAGPSGSVMGSEQESPGRLISTSLVLNQRLSDYIVSKEPPSIETRDTGYISSPLGKVRLFFLYACRDTQAASEPTRGKARC